MRLRILDNKLFIYLANHGAELDYIVGTLFNSLNTAISRNRTAITLSSEANLGITVGWNYLDAVYDFMLAAEQLADTRTYRRTQNRIQAGLNIISGLQLFILSYNPLFTTCLGLPNETSLAASSFAFSALFDLFVAALEFYNTQKAMAFKGWLDESIKELVYKIKNGHDHDELVKDLHFHASASAAKDPHRQEHIKQMLSQQFAADHPVVNLIVQNLDSPTGEHIERSRRVQQQLLQAHKDSRINLNLKSASFVGMTLLAVARFLDSESDNANNTLIVGLLLSTYVACAYLAYNSERFIDTVQDYSFRFYAKCSNREHTTDIHLPQCNL